MQRELMASWRCGFFVDDLPGSTCNHSGSMFSEWRCCLGMCYVPRQFKLHVDELANRARKARRSCPGSSAHANVYVVLVEYATWIHGLLESSSLGCGVFVDNVPGSTCNHNGLIFSEWLDWKIGLEDWYLAECHQCGPCATQTFVVWMHLEN